jgi:hypothetical protein
MVRVNNALNISILKKVIGVIILSIPMLLIKNSDVIEITRHIISIFDENLDILNVLYLIIEYENIPIRTIIPIGP